eukprot:m.30950 g.30950  ORF g.30950 m.30950 type:complete len:353 (+) comp12020_c0_seq1:167-1225(+)
MAYRQSHSQDHTSWRRRSYAAQNQAELKVRPEKDELPLGRAGRIERPGHRHIPLAKKWYAGYNAQAQDSDLVEDLPVGLRNRRLCCVVSTIVLGFVLSLVTLALLIWTLSILDFDVRGSGAAVVRESSMGFLLPVKVFGTVLISGQEDKALRAPEGENLNFHVSDKLKMLSIDPTANLMTRMDVSAQSTQMDAEKVVFNDRTDTPTFVELDPEQTILGTRHTLINADALRTDGQAKVCATKFVGPVNQPFSAESSTNMSMAAFRDIDINSQTANTTVTAQGELNINARTSGILGELTMDGADARLSLASLLARSSVSSSDTAFSVCVCSTGRLYLSSATSVCPAVEPADCNV